MTIYSLDVLLSQFEPVCCFMSSFNCCFMTCIQVSQKAGKVFCLKIVQFIVIHAVKVFSVINKTEVDFFFLEFPFFLWDPINIGNLISGPLPFLNTARTSVSSQFLYCWSLTWRILSITLLVCKMSTIVQ